MEPAAALITPYVCFCGTVVPADGGFVAVVSSPATQAAVDLKQFDASVTVPSNGRCVLIADPSQSNSLRLSPQTCRFVSWRPEPDAQ